MLETRGTEIIISSVSDTITHSLGVVNRAGTQRMMARGNIHGDTDDGRLSLSPLWAVISALHGTRLKSAEWVWFL